MELHDSSKAKSELIFAQALKALRTSRGTVPKKRFLEIAKNIPELVKRANMAEREEIIILFGYRRGARLGLPDLKDEITKEAKLIEQSSSAELRKLKQRAELLVINAYLLTSFLSDDEQKAWPVPSKAIHLYESMDD